MRRTIDEAIELLSQTFPNLSVTIHDGDHDYLVGTIEDGDEHIVASFLLLLDTSNNEIPPAVTAIRIGEQQFYCGTASHTPSREPQRYMVPIQITRRDDRGSLWGLVGDYEINVNESSLLALSSNNI